MKYVCYGKDVCTDKNMHVNDKYLYQETLYL